MTQHHQIMCDWKIYIQTGTYQESLNNWRKQRLLFLNSSEKSFISGSDEQFTSLNIAPIHSEVVLHEGELIHPHDKDSVFAIMYDCTDTCIKFPKWSYVLKVCSEFPGVFITFADMNDDKDVDLPFIHFHLCEDFSSCSLHK